MVSEHRWSLIEVVFWLGLTFLVNQCRSDVSKVSNSDSVLVLTVSSRK